MTKDISYHRWHLSTSCHLAADTKHWMSQGKHRLWAFFSWRRKIGILYQSIYIYIIDLRMFRSQQCKHWKSQSHSFHTHGWHLIPIPPLLPYTASSVGTSVAVTWRLCTSRLFAAMRRCPTGGIVDFGGCWRSRNSIHIYHIYIHICIYIYML